MNQLQTLLHDLRLSGLRETLPVRLQEALANRLTHGEFLTLALQDEINIRAQRKIQRRVKTADFRTLKPLDEFDWRFNPSIPRKPIYELATGHFIRAKQDVLFIGPPGTGKTHLAQAIGYEAIKQGFTVCYRSIFDLVRDFLAEDALQKRDRVLQAYLKADLLIIDDMGLRALPKHSGEYLLEVIMRRYETRSTIMTSNRPLEDWGKLLQDVATGRRRPRPLPPSRHRHRHHRRELPPQGQRPRQNQLQETCLIIAHPQMGRALRQAFWLLSSVAAHPLAPRTRPTPSPRRHLPCPLPLTLHDLHTFSGWLVLTRPDVAGFNPAGDTRAPTIFHRVCGDNKSRPSLNLSRTHAVGTEESPHKSLSSNANIHVFSSAMQLTFRSDRHPRRSASTA